MTKRNGQPESQEPIADGVDEAVTNPTKWDDPSVPVGNAPPMSRWPLVLMTIAWTAWVVFLVVMMISVRQSHGG